MIDLEFWDNFYSELERNFRACGIDYTRPVNWKERAYKAENSTRKPNRTQHEGLSRSFDYD